MTDQELLALAEEKAVSELTPEELDYFRARLQQSTVLAEFFQSRLRWQQYHAELRERIGAESRPMRPPSKVVPRRLLLLAIGCGIVAIGGIALRWTNSRSPGSVRQADKPEEVVRGEMQLSADAELAATAQTEMTTPAEASPSAMPAVESSIPDAAGSQQTPTESLLSFAEVCFRLRSGNLVRSVEQLSDWFEPIGLSSGWISERTASGPGMGIRGIHQLTVEWPANGFLQLSLSTQNAVQLHFFAGTHGATFVYYPDSNRWAGYATEREPSAAIPLRWSLASTDDGRSAQSGMSVDAAFAIHLQSDSLCLARGDVVLVTVPMPGRPTATFFEGQAIIQDIDFVRYDGVLPFSRSASPAENSRQTLSWSSGHPPHVEIQGGGILLPQGCLSTARLDAQGAGQYLFKINHAHAGDAIRVVRSDGRTVANWHYVDDQAGRMRLVCDWANVTLAQSVSDAPVPFVGISHWLRIVIGANVVRWWIGVDGTNWGSGGTPVVVDTIGVQHLMMAAAEQERAAELEVERAQFQPFAATGLDLQLPQAVLSVGAPSYERWLAKVTAARPAEIERGSWLAACAWTQLSHGGIGPESPQLAELIVREAFHQQLPTRGQIQLLKQIEQLLEPSVSFHERYQRWFLRLGRAALDEPQPRPFSRIRRGVMEAGLPPPGKLWDRLITAELLALLDAQSWPDVVRLCERLNYFELHHATDVAGWAASQAIPEHQDSSSLTVRHRRSWRELLVQEASSALYRAEAELRAATGAKEWKIACEIIARSGFDALEGYAEVAGDERLLMSWPAIIDDSFSRSQPLQRAMQSHSDVANLQAEQAIAQGDVQQARTVATKFPGTSAASRVNRWLAKRAITAGWFEAGKRRFQSSLQSEGARAAMGQLPVSQAVAQILAGAPKPLQDDGDSTATVDDLTLAVAELRMATEPADDHLLTDQPEQQLQQPTRPAVSNFAIREPTGAYPTKSTLPHLRELDIDWVGRQLGITLRDEMIYLSNRFQIQAIDAANGLPVWQSEEVPGRAGMSQEWSLVPMPPTIFRDHVVARFLRSSGLMLGCFDRRTGSLVWSTAAPSESEFVSDPWWANDKLFCLATRKTDLSQLELQLAQLDPATGSIRRLLRLLSMQDHWKLRRVCQIAVLEENAIVALGGIVCCFDFEGQIRWLRRTRVIPPEADGRWVRQEYQPPRRIGDRVVLGEPGGWSLSCLSANTGRRHWHRILPEMISVVSSNEQIVIVREETAIRALDVESGETRWINGDQRFSAVTSSGDGASLLLVQGPEDSASDGGPNYVQLDFLTGERVASGVLPRVTGFASHVGPAFIAGKNLWVTSGARDNPLRTIWQISPSVGPDTGW